MWIVLNNQFYISFLVSMSRIQNKYPMSIYTYYYTEPLLQSVSVNSGSWTAGQGECSCLSAVLVQNQLASSELKTSWQIVNKTTLWGEKCQNYELKSKSDDCWLKAVSYNFQNFLQRCTVMRTILHHIDAFPGIFCVFTDIKHFLENEKVLNWHSLTSRPIQQHP